MTTRITAQLSVETGATNNR